MTVIVSKNPANKAELRHFFVPRVVVPRSMLSNVLQIDCDDKPVIKDFSTPDRGIADVAKFQQPHGDYNRLEFNKILAGGENDAADEARHPGARFCHLAGRFPAPVSFFIQIPAPDRPVAVSLFPPECAGFLPGGIASVLKRRRSSPPGDSGP
jgi:hypothetical protein